VIVNKKKPDVEWNDASRFSGISQFIRDLRELLRDQIGISTVTFV